MCVVIDPDFILANLFLAGKEYVTVRDLTQIRRKIEATQGGIFINVSMNSIHSVVEQRPDMFIWDGDRIRKTGASELFTAEYVEEHFNWNCPKAVVEIVRESAGNSTI